MSKYEAVYFLFTALTHWVSVGVLQGPVGNRSSAFLKTVSHFL